MPRPAEDVMTYCPTCHVELQVGTWPWCPHGQSRLVAVPDSIIGGITVDNYGPEPITFYSHAERRRYMAAQGLAERETWAPLPGTDTDPQGIPNPNGYRDLSAGAILARNGRSSVTPHDPTDRWDIPNEPGASDPHLRLFNTTEDPT